MKVLILSDARSIHTKRWIKSLADKGIEIFLFSLTHPDDFYTQFRNIKIEGYGMQNTEGFFKKIKYLKTLPQIRKIIKEFTPDILHAHYASSYGLLGALTNFHPYIVSVWGSDVYDFPNDMPLGKQIIRHVLKKADVILSTSHVMAKETAKYTDKPIEVTPFGVDMLKFRKIEDIESKEEFVVGNVKSLEPKYGIDVLIRSYKIIVDSNPTLRTRLDIYGKGSKRKEYEKLAYDLGIADKVHFKGYVDNKYLAEVYNSFSVSVSVSVSNSESFGVVVVEAMACECPVITSDADGFTEVVKNGETGYIVPKSSPELTAKAIQKFIDNPSLKSLMGKAGREHVRKNYNWENNVDLMMNIYNKIKNR